MAGVTGISGVGNPGLPTETLDEKIARVLKDVIRLVDYDPRWPAAFELERDHLLRILPSELIGRIEHFGSTAVPGLAAKPIVDVLVEVTCLAQTRERIVPLMEPLGYEFFWRPSFGDDIPPWYAWFIKRDDRGHRSHHLHFVESGFPQWDSLLFRDHLISNPRTAREYADLKRDLASKHPNDRVAYTSGKTDFISRITTLAKASRCSAGASAASC